MLTEEQKIAITAVASGMLKYGRADPKHMAWTEAVPIIYTFSLGMGEDVIPFPGVYALGFVDALKFMESYPSLAEQFLTEQRRMEGTEIDKDFQAEDDNALEVLKYIVETCRDQV